MSGASQVSFNNTAPRDGGDPAIGAAAWDKVLSELGMNPHDLTFKSPPEGQPGSAPAGPSPPPAPLPTLDVGGTAPVASDLPHLPRIVTSGGQTATPAGGAPGAALAGTAIAAGEGAATGGIGDALAAGAGRLGASFAAALPEAGAGLLVGAAGGGFLAGMVPVAAGVPSQTSGTGVAGVSVSYAPHETMPVLHWTDRDGRPASMQLTMDPREPGALGTPDGRVVGRLEGNVPRLDPQAVTAVLANPAGSTVRPGNLAPMTGLDGAGPSGGSPPLVPPLLPPDRPGTAPPSSETQRMLGRPETLPIDPDAGRPSVVSTPPAEPISTVLPGATIKTTKPQIFEMAGVKIMPAEQAKRDSILAAKELPTSGSFPYVPPKSWTSTQLYHEVPEKGLWM